MASEMTVFFSCPYLMYKQMKMKQQCRNFSQRCHIVTYINMILLFFTILKLTVGLRNILRGNEFSTMRENCSEIVWEKEKTSELALKGAPERF